MGLKQTVAPAVDPVTITEARKVGELPSDDTAHDAHLYRLIAAATRTVERMTRRALITQTWELRLDAFPGHDFRRQNAILLPRPPLQSVSSIVYIDEAGATQTLDPSLYQVTTNNAPGFIEPAYAQVWPTTRPETVEPVRITYIAGFGDDATSVPEEYRHAVLELVAFWFFNRGDVQAEIPKHIEWSLASLKCGATLGYYGVKG